MDLTIDFNLAALAIIAVMIYIGYKLINSDSDD